MLTESARFDRRANAGANRQGHPRIASIGIPTCNRVEALKRALVSYIENCRRHDRRNDFVIVDDSPRLETRIQCRRMLQSLSRGHGVEVSYAGLEEKMRFAKRLIERGGGPPEIVKFALFDLEKYGGSTLGANRNALLLHTVGDLALSADDDTVCRIGVAPDLRQGLSFVSDRRFSASHPCEVWSFPDRETALSSVRSVDEDLLTLHEQVLGKDLATCIEEQGRGAEIDYSRAKANFISDIRANRGRVAVTLTGYVGDCGWPSPTSYLFMTDRSFDRITSSESIYNSCCRSREILRVVNSAMIAEETNFMSLSYGFDNRRLLPPFIPVGRGEDTLFGYTLVHCFSGSYIAHLPWVLSHLPVENRGFWHGEITRSVSGATMTLLISLLIKSFKSELDAVDGEAKLACLGRRFESMGNMPMSDFETYVYPQVQQEATTLITYLEDRLRNSDRLPPFWVKDVRRAIDISSRHISNRDFWVPLDLLDKRDIGGARLLAQRLILRFGQLLRWWPEIVRASHELRVEGYRLAQSVSDNFPQ